MSDIPALTQQIDNLSSSSDWWITAGLMLTGLVAFLGLLLFIAQWRAIIVGNSRDAAREALGDAKDKAFRIDIEERKKENLKLSLQLEAEQRQRIELIKAASFRDVILTPFPFLNINGISVELVSARGSEPMWVAWQIGSGLSSAGWTIIKSTQSDEPMRAGIVVQSNVGGIDRGAEARDAVVAELQKVGVGARTLPAELPTNTIRIVVGPSDRLTTHQVTTGGKHLDPLNPDFDPADLPPLRTLPKVDDEKSKQSDNQQSNPAE